ncbi:PAS domain-containing protein [Flavobacterium sp.]|uniref:PAS domain-containing sensor histidine kinase n=1 Tax=Flavobacterium sp. TaxID=239 RepID=UPI00262F9E8B|nr:PAS domain-containing protein [Flavobacterium sp.]MDG2433340.1 PAS domain-containing protein [Flavobacterium sp.]
MKNKTTPIILIYLLTALFTMLVFHKIEIQYSLTKHYPVLNFYKDLLFVLSSALLFKYIFAKNNRRNALFFDKLNQTNKEIKESNDKYDIVAKATSDTIWDWKIQEDEMVWSKGISAVYGYDNIQIGARSKWWFENIHPEDSIKMSVKLYSFLEQKTEKWQDEYRFKCADNTYKYVLDRGFLLKDKNGTAVRMIGAIQDITKQKEEELRLKLLETVIVQTKESIVITKAVSENKKFSEIVYVNPAFTRMTGFMNQEVLGRKPNLFQGQLANLAAARKIIEALQTRTETQIETLSIRKNGEQFWLYFSMIPVYNNKNEFTHWVSVQKDITQEKLQQKEKEQLISELTQNNKDLKQFSYVTSHNLRAPISNLIGLLMLTDHMKIEDTELEEIIGGFKTSTNLLSETINDLTKVMLIKDNIPVAEELVNLAESFEHICKELSFQLDKHKPTLQVNFENCTEIITNKTYLESIILNLLTNSIKYKAKDRALLIKIEAVTREDDTIIKIIDNGIGIDLERNKEKIFGLYQRFHDYPDSKGLGLYLVKSQIEAMKGSIKIESAVNIGTTFTLIFKKK